MKVYVLGKNQFDSLMDRQQVTDDSIAEKTDVFIISINNTQNCDSINVPYFKENKSNLKIMYFDDVDSDIYDTKLTTDENGKVVSFLDYTKIIAKAMTYDQAVELVDFIVANKNKKQCIVHCTAGISRSGAIGMFINELYGEIYSEFIRKNSNIHPNTYILNLLRKAYSQSKL